MSNQKCQSRAVERVSGGRSVQWLFNVCLSVQYFSLLFSSLQCCSLAFSTVRLTSGLELTVHWVLNVCSSERCFQWKPTMKTSLVEFMNYQSITGRCGQLWCRVQVIQRYWRQRSLLWVQTSAGIDALPSHQTTAIADTTHTTDTTDIADTTDTTMTPQSLSIWSVCLSLTLYIASVNCIACDHNKYTTGCEDRIGSFCNQTSNQCECRLDFEVQLSDRFCLKKRALFESCFISEQCLNDSKCFGNSSQLSSTSIELRPDVPLSPEGLCLCPPTHFASAGNSCQERRGVGQSCEDDSQCLQPNSVCNATTGQCACNHTYVFSSVIGHCVKGKYLGEQCSGREECQYSEEYSWCIDNICMCGAGYTPDKNSYNGSPQCVIDSMIVERVEPTIGRRADTGFDYMTVLLIIAFLIAFVIAIGIARRNRNSIMQMIRPSSDLQSYPYHSEQSDQSHDESRDHSDQSNQMIPFDNTINGINSCDITANVEHNSKQSLQSTKLLPNINIELDKNYWFLHSFRENIFSK